jgi:Zn-dependent peptidase ImmA (M78 family)
MHCPVYRYCPLRGSNDVWCGEDHGYKFNQLVDSDSQFNPNDFECLRLSENGSSWGLFKFVEKIANAQLKKTRADSVPISTEVALRIDKEGYVEVQLLPIRSCHGALWRRANKWVIQVKADDTPQMRRFTLFHEAFHILAHCNTRPVFSKVGKTQGSFNEMLANYFAICMMMPRKLVEQKWQESRSLEKMAEIFDVPKSAMWFRLTQVGLV